MVTCSQVWKPIQGYEERYIISNLGKIKSLNKKNSGKYLRERVDRAYYSTVRLSKNGVTKTKFLHRLLAETFIEQPFGKFFVNHINGETQDNHLTNLEWVTHPENISHAYKSGSITKKTKAVIDKSSGQRFSSCKDASLYHNIKYKTLRGYLNGQRKNPTTLRYETK